MLCVINSYTVIKVILLLIVTVTNSYIVINSYAVINSDTVINSYVVINN